MSEGRPFIPRDKPKFFVLGALAGFIGLASGVVAFASASFGFSLLKALSTIVFIACCAVFFVSWFGCLFGYLSGRYARLTAKPWREQVW